MRNVTNKEMVEETAYLAKFSKRRGNTSQCNHCKKFGHMEDDCWHKGKPQCYKCKRFGHLLKDCRAPPATFPRAENKLIPISLPEDVYIKKFFQKHPESKHQDAIKISGFDPPPARIFGCRVLELKEQGVTEEEAMAVADMEYRAERKAKKKAYSRLKQIARLQGKRPPPNPYSSAIKEIQAEERKFVHDRFHNRDIIKIAERLKEERQAELADRRGGGGL